jgi:hypothetical protein
MIKRILPNLCITLALVMLTLFILAQYNPGIVDSDFFAIIMYALCGAVVVTSGVFIAHLRRG